jgi:hypothetical protein
MTEEIAILGWKAIGQMFHKSEVSMIKRKPELQSCGAIFYMWVGRPRRRVVAAFPSMLMRWAAAKTLHGEEV